MSTNHCIVNIIAHLSRYSEHAAMRQSSYKRLNLTVYSITTVFVQ